MGFRLYNRCSCVSVSGVTKDKAQSLARQIVKSLDDDSIHVALEKVEREAVELALGKTRGNCAAAADLLNIGRTSLVEKRRRYGMKMREVSPRRTG